MALDPNLSPAIAEGQRFIQLLHGVEWMTTLCQTVVDADKLVDERQRIKDALDASILATHAEHDAYLQKISDVAAANKDAYDKQEAAAVARISALQDAVAKLELEHEGIIAQWKAEADAHAASVLAAQKESDAKQADADATLAATQKAIADLHDKIGKI